MREIVWFVNVGIGIFMYVCVLNMEIEAFIIINNRRLVG